MDSDRFVVLMKGCSCGYETTIIKLFFNINYLLLYFFSKCCLRKCKLNKLNKFQVYTHSKSLEIKQNSKNLQQVSFFFLIDVKLTSYFIFRKELFTVYQIALRLCVPFVTDLTNNAWQNTCFARIFHILKCPVLRGRRVNI